MALYLVLYEDNRRKRSQRFNSVEEVEAFCDEQEAAMKHAGFGVRRNRDQDGYTVDLIFEPPPDSLSDGTRLAWMKFELSA